MNQKGRRGALHCQPSARLKGDRWPLALTVCLPHVVELRLHCPRVDLRSHRVRVLDDVVFAAGAGARPLPTCKYCDTGSDQRAASCKQRRISAVHSVLPDMSNTSYVVEEGRSGGAFPLTVEIDMQAKNEGATSTLHASVLVGRRGAPCGAAHASRIATRR